MYFIKINNWKSLFIKHKDNFYIINYNITIPFHVRYGRSNLKGYEIFYLNNFIEIYSDCIYNKNIIRNKEEYFKYLFGNSDANIYYTNIFLKNKIKIKNYVGKVGHELFVLQTTFITISLIFLILLYFLLFK